VRRVVETQAAAQALLPMGCNFRQGTFLSAPVEAEQALDICRHYVGPAPLSADSPPSPGAGKGHGAGDTSWCCPDSPTLYCRPTLNARITINAIAVRSVTWQAEIAPHTQLAVPRAVAQRAATTLNTRRPLDSVRAASACSPAAGWIGRLPRQWIRRLLVLHLWIGESDRVHGCARFWAAALCSSATYCGRFPSSARGECASCRLISPPPTRVTGAVSRSPLLLLSEYAIVVLDSLQILEARLCGFHGSGCNSIVDHVWLISDGSTDNTAKRLSQAGCWVSMRR